MNTQFSIHLQEDIKVNVSMNYELIPGRHGVNIQIGKLGITLFGSSEELCRFRDAVASGIAPPLKGE